MRKDLTIGGITKTILVTAMPMVFALILHTGFNIVDAIYVGRISAEAIAAVSLAWPIMFFVYALAGGVGVGATSLISRYVGAKEIEKADNVAEHALLVGVVLGVVFTVLGLVFGRGLLMLMGADSLAELSLSYLNVIFIGIVFMMIFVVGNNIFRGEGDMKTPMIFMTIATVVNIILDPIFIFVLGMGVKGAAIATIISNFIGCVSVIVGFVIGKSSVKIRPKCFRFDLGIVKKIFTIGIPSSLSQVSMSISLFVLTRIVATFGPYAIAAFGIGFRLDSIAILPTLGLMMALIPIVGQNVGAKKINRAEKSAYTTAALAAAFTGFVGLMFILFPSFFVSLFNSQPEVLRDGALYLRIVGLSYVFAGVGISISGAFLGAGDAFPALMLTLLRVIILSIPLALVFAFVLGWGLKGVWWAISFSGIISSIIGLIWFRKGGWKKKHAKMEIVVG